MATGEPARSCRRSRAARHRDAREAGARSCPRATSRPCAGAGSARPGQGLWSWRHPVGSVARPSRSGAGSRLAKRRSATAGAAGAAAQPWGVARRAARMSAACRQVRRWRCRVSMPPVEQRPPPAGNPGASLYVRLTSLALPVASLAPQCSALAPAPGALRVAMRPCQRALVALRGLAPGIVAGLTPARPAAIPVAAVAVAAQRRPGCGIARIGTGGRDGPDCTPAEPSSAGRTRPSGPHCCGTAFIGTVSGAARSSSFPARETVAVPTFFGSGRVVLRRPPSPPTCQAALQGGLTDSPFIDWLLGSQYPGPPPHGRSQPNPRPRHHISADSNQRSQRLKVDCAGLRNLSVIDQCLACFRRAPDSFGADPLVPTRAWGPRRRSG